MICEELKSRKNFVEEDFIELRDSVEGLISVIEKYKDMRKDSDEYIMELKEFLEEVNLTLEEKKITDKELKNLNFLRKVILIHILIVFQNMEFMIKMI